MASLLGQIFLYGLAVVLDEAGSFSVSETLRGEKVVEVQSGSNCSRSEEVIEEL